MTIMKKLAAFALAGALALGSAGVALAQGISLDDARRIALEHVPGTVIEIERDDDDGVPEWEVEVRGEDGFEYEVTIDARNGRVIKIERD